MMYINSSQRYSWLASYCYCLYLQDSQVIKTHGSESRGQEESACTRVFMQACHSKNGPGKNGPAGPILDEKMVRPDHFWLTKNGPAGLILVTKSGPGHELSTADSSTMGIVVFSSFSLACSCFT